MPDRLTERQAVRLLFGAIALITLGAAFLAAGVFISSAVTKARGEIGARDA